MDFGCLFDGKYRIVRLIGSGGCGRVYLAENIRAKTLWAIKEIPYDGNNTLQVEREIDVLKKICHPALPRIVDVLREDKLIYIIEDYFEGSNVEEILRECECVKAATAAKWARDICDIMIFLHGQKPDPIIYRDLKPSNIILSPDGMIKLVDFGSVRHYKSDSPSDTVYIGTRGYAAPEQYGSGQTTKQTDIYSFGITMLRIMTGKRPANAVPGGNVDIAEVMNASYYKTSSRDDIDTCGCDNPPISFIKTLINIFIRCIEIEPDKRYQDFNEIKSALNDLSGITPGSDEAAVPLRRTEKSISGHYQITDNFSGAPRDNDNSDIERSGITAARSRLKRQSRSKRQSLPKRQSMPPLQSPPLTISQSTPFSQSTPLSQSIPPSRQPSFSQSIPPSKPPSQSSLSKPPSSSSPSPSQSPLPSPSQSPSLPRPFGIYRCATISVTQNHEFAFELAYRISEHYDLRTLIVDIDFETTLSELYFMADEKKSCNIYNNSLRHTLELIEQAAFSGWPGDEDYEIKDCADEKDIDGSAGNIPRDEAPVSGISFLSGLRRGGPDRPELVWLNEPNPEYSGTVADMLTRNRGAALRRLLSEVTAFADVCILLTGNSLFSELNLRCFQNSHYIICPGRPEIPVMRAFKNTATLAERFKGIPSDRFKYIIWEYRQNDIKPEISRALAEESLAGVVRKSRRRDNARRGGAYGGCYAYAMERAVKKDYDEIIRMLGIAGGK